MRTRIAAGLVAAAAVVGTLGLGASQAAAATTSGGQQQAVTEGAAAQDGPAGWVLRDKYWQHGNCVTAGEEGKQRGHWDDFQCASGTAQWVLWTNR